MAFRNVLQIWWIFKQYFQSYLGFCTVRVRGARVRGARLSASYLEVRKKKRFLHYTSNYRLFTIGQLIPSLAAAFCSLSFEQRKFYSEFTICVTPFQVRRLNDTNCEDECQIFTLLLTEFNDRLLQV